MVEILGRLDRRLKWVSRRVQHRLDNWLVGRVSPAPAAPLDRGLTAVVMRLNQGLSFYLDGLAGQAELWEGKEIDTGQPLRVGYLGSEQAYRRLSPPFLQALLFQPGTLETRPFAETSMLRTQPTANRLAKASDLVIVERSPLVGWRPTAGEWALTPMRVRLVFDFAPGEDWNAVQRRMHGQKKNLKLARQQGFTFRVSHADADFDFFYERMHVPMINARHGDYGITDSKKGLLTGFRQMGLLMLVYPPDERSGGLPVAGKLVYQHGKVIYGIANGTLDGDPCWHAQGALSALNYHSLRWCFDNGIARYDFGYCPPFANHGLYLYKLRWGFTPSADPWSLRNWLFWLPPGASSAAQHWLAAHPLVKPIAGSGDQANSGLAPATGEQTE